jgi:hypothetical protein
MGFSNCWARAAWEPSTRLVRDHHLERIVALKVIRPELARNAAVLRFKRELILGRGRRDRGLIPQIQGRFYVFLAIDKGFEFEQSIKKLSFGV